MKLKAILILSSALISLGAQAATVICGADKGTGYTRTGTCSVIHLNESNTEEVETLNFEATEIHGLDLMTEGLSFFTLICPAAFSKNLTKASFYGIDGAAAFGVGLEGGAFVSSRGAVCAFAGGKFDSGGARLNDIRITFTKYVDPDSEYLSTH